MKDTTKKGQKTKLSWLWDCSHWPWWMALYSEEIEQQNAIFVFLVPVKISYNPRDCKVFNDGHMKSRFIPYHIWWNWEEHWFHQAGIIRGKNWLHLITLRLPNLRVLRTCKWTWASFCESPLQGRLRFTILIVTVSHTCSQGRYTLCCSVVYNSIFEWKIRKNSVVIKKILLPKNKSLGVKSYKNILWLVFCIHSCVLTFL